MGHDHHHHHSASSNLGLAFALNVCFTLVELVGAWFTNSTAIAADALHDLGDSMALAFAWGMERWSHSKPSPSYSYGLKRLSLLGALVNAVILVGGGIFVLAETVPRLWDPPTPHAPGMIALAILGIVVNGLAAYRVGRGTSLNERVVTWHLLEDVMGWVAVLVVGVAMTFTELAILDPLLSVGITLWIAYNAAKHAKTTINLFLQATPPDVDIDRLTQKVQELDGVVSLAHIHVWSQEGEHHVMTAQLLIDPMSLEAAMSLQDSARSILEKNGISHVTLELDCRKEGEIHCESAPH